MVTSEEDNGFLRPLRKPVFEFNQLHTRRSSSQRVMEAGRIWLYDINSQEGLHFKTLVDTNVYHTEREIIVQHLTISSICLSKISLVRHNVQETLQVQYVIQFQRQINV